MRAFLYVHSATPRDWTEAEVSLVEEVAARTWAEVEAGAADRSAVEQVMLEDMLDRLGPGGIYEGGRLLADLL